MIKLREITESGWFDLKNANNFAKHKKLQRFA
jgi:hypothetical protein